MFVGALKLDLQILGSRSLKEKRMVLRRIKDRVRERFGLIVAEVGSQELWQRAQLGTATASGDRGKLMELLDGASRCIAGAEGVELLARWREVSAFAGQLETDGLGEALAEEELAEDELAENAVTDEGRDDGDGEPGRERNDAGAAGQGRGQGLAGPGKKKTPWTPPEWQRMLDEETR